MIIIIISFIKIIVINFRHFQNSKYNQNIINFTNFGLDNKNYFYSFMISKFIMIN